MRTGILLFAVCLLALGQPQAGFYCATKTTALSGAAEVVTVQQPATGARSVSFSGASIYASVETGLLLQRDGTAASSTTLAPAKLNASADTAAATAWSSSNVGSGTTLAAYTVPAGGTLVLDLSGIWLLGNGTAKNLTLRTASVTGTVKINICWREN
jgi:hypothetical protein